MRKYWGWVVGKLWGWHGQAPLLYSATFDKQTTPVGITAVLHTSFARASSVVSHSTFSNLTAVGLRLSPTFHSTNKDNYKVYKLVIS